MACLFAAGFMQSMSVVSMVILLRRTAAPQFRGRLMGARMLGVYGHPLGLLIAGPLIEWIGYTGTASLNGAIGLVCTAAIVMRWGANLLRPAPAVL